MLAFFKGLVIAFAEGGGHSGAEAGGWYAQAEPYLNYPGFEVWRFFNLFIFILIMIYLLRKPLGDAFKAKREVIRAELIKAKEEKEEAEAELEAAEARLSTIPEERKSIIEAAKAEAADEKRRIEEETENDIKRAAEQAKTELTRKADQVRVQLRRFSAQESIRLAEEKIRKSMTPQVDAGLVKANIESIGGLK